MAEMKKRNTIHTQLNEKVSETQYDVLHPETHADVVITTENKQFVSQEEKDRWDNIESKGLTYQGDWNSSIVYSSNDVVQYNGKYYISLADHVNRTPSETADTGYWRNINLEAYLATRADNVKISEVTGNSYKKIILESNQDGLNSEYSNLGYDNNLQYSPNNDTLTVGTGENQITINGSNGTVTANKFVGELDGKASDADHADTADRATEAEKYVTYERDEDGNLVNGVRTESGSEYIDDRISGMQQQIDDITSGTGGAVLSNKLTIQKDGVSVAQFDGSQAVNVDIKQTYTPEEISGLLDTNKKIQEKWLPDTIFGQLEYKGTWNPSIVMSGIIAQDGNYWIAVGKPGNYAPDGTLVAETASTVPEFFGVGDWAVYHDGKWDKVDNTDAVTTVNSQRGAVETYKGNWLAETQYFKGDIVKYDNKLYICHTTHISTTSFQDTNWDLFGRTYSATDGIKIEDETIKHDVALETGKTTNITLFADQSFDMPILTRDSFGHITKIDINRISLGTDFVDTTREIQVNGSKILEGTGVNKNKALNFKGSTWIDVKYENDALNFTHTNNTIGAIDLNPEIINVSTSEDIIYSGTGFSIPQIKVDGAGHIVTAEMKEFKLANTLIKHDHFNITKSADGSQVIGAYGADVADDTWVGDAANKLKFYLGAQNPIRTERMNFNGSFFATKFSQSGNDVLDNTLKIYQGKDYPSASMGETGAAQDLFTQYNTVTKRFEMAKILGFEDSENIVYSAVNVNNRGLVTAGGQIVEFGTQENADPSESLVVGGLFFRMIGTVTG